MAHTEDNDKFEIINLAAVKLPYIYIYIYIYDRSVGVHRYTRWTGRLSHQTSNLSHPCNLLPKGCDPSFT